MSHAPEEATKKAIARYASSAEMEHLRLLGDGRLTSSRCDRCRRIAWPPRSFCPFCGFDRVTVTDIGEGATLYAFSQQHRALRFTTPEVLGLVEIPEVGRILSVIDAPIESLSIGMPLELGFVEILPDLRVHRFRPTAR